MSEQAHWPRASDRSFRLVDVSSPLRAGWFGERWPTGRAALVAAALGLYALAFGPLYSELGLGVTALSVLPVLLAAGLLGQRGGAARCWPGDHPTIDLERSTAG